MKSPIGISSHRHNMYTRRMHTLVSVKALKILSDFCNEQFFKNLRGSCITDYTIDTATEHRTTVLLMLAKYKTCYVKLY